MKTRTIHASLAVFAVLVGAGCTSGISTRIQEKTDIYNRIPPEAQKNLREGTIETGYTADMVYMALGSPSKVKVKDTSHGKVGLWIYENFFPEGYVAAPGSVDENAPEVVPTTSNFIRAGGPDYGFAGNAKPIPSYTATDRRGFKPYAANASTFDARSGAMEALDVPEMDSAALYVIFYRGEVVQMKLGKN